MKRPAKWYKNLNLNRRFIFSLNFTVVIFILIISLFITVNFVNRQKSAAADNLFNELGHLTALLDMAKEFDMEAIRDHIYGKSFYNTGYVSVIDRNGNILISSHNEGANISGEPFFRDIEIMREGKSRYFDETEGRWKWQYFTWYSPMQSYIVATIDQGEFIVKPVFNTLIILLLIMIIALIVFSTVGYYIIRTVSEPVKKLVGSIDKLGRGVLPKKLDFDYQDEVGKMTGKVNNLIDGLKKTALFAKEIENGNFDYEYTPLSEDDILGNALLDMRQSLKNASEEDKERKSENEKRNWATQGIAMFGEILRQNYTDIHELSFNIIKNLVDYLGANQGGFFIINDEGKEQKYLELTACYAYDRRKFMEKHIMIGEGLVGACYLEKQTIHLMEIPDNYIHITSGLGGENPAALIIVPAKSNEEIYGIIELASFRNFEDYQIEFVEKVGESIASTVSNMKISRRTAMLLEKSQKQAEEMRAQEEEMRQNMEELHATQESMTEKERENQQKISKLNAELAEKEKQINKLSEKIKTYQRNVDDIENSDPVAKDEIAEKDNAENIEEKDNEDQHDMKDVYDDSRSGSQKKWSEHLKESFKQFRKGRKK